MKKIFLFLFLICYCGIPKGELPPIVIDLPDENEDIDIPVDIQFDVPDCYVRVFNRGIPPLGAMEELIKWAIEEEDSVFQKNDKYDIYSSVSKELGTSNDLSVRKSILVESLRVLSGFESSWDWSEGIDITNPTSNTDLTREAGIFQTSCNSLYFTGNEFFLNSCGATDCRTFQTCSKSNKRFAIGQAARVLRQTVNHHGPVKRKEINPWLRPRCAEQVRKYL